MSSEMFLALLAIIVPTIAAITGLYQAKLSRRNKEAEADKTQAEADTLAAQVKVLYLENEKHLLERVAALERDKYTCAGRLNALEAERDKDKRQMETSRKIQEALEAEIASLQTRLRQMEAAEAVRIEEVRQLRAENQKLKLQMEQLASRVETGELASGSHQIPRG